MHKYYWLHIDTQYKTIEDHLFQNKVLLRSTYLGQSIDPGLSETLKSQYRSQNEIYATRFGFQVPLRCMYACILIRLVKVISIKARG